MNGFQWLRFLRQYGPIARADNMYDETIQRSARRSGVAPIYFVHPAQEEVLNCFAHGTTSPVSVILTGTAGDGKTHLCRQVWEKLNGDPTEWATDNPYLCLEAYYPNNLQTWQASNNSDSIRQVTIHFIRDLSAWAPQQGLPWEPEKNALLQRLCKSIYDVDTTEVFLVAANDGQLIESWRRLGDTEYVIRARKLFEDLLVEDRQQQEGVRLRMFNLSRGNSAELFDRAYGALITHTGWESCYSGSGREDQGFGLKCPIRRNFELLKTPLVHSRIRALIELCDHNGLHLPIRQIILMLANAVLGHPDCNREHLMTPENVPKIIRSGTVSKGSLYNNIFGGNLPETRRQGIAIFEYLERFQIGYETSNRIDNILIFGEGDPDLDHHFTTLLRQDTFYGADERYFAARDRYIEGSDDDPKDAEVFLDLLVSQRRGLFFKIPDVNANELNLWALTVFRFAGEYLSDILGGLRSKSLPNRAITGRLIKGLNRIFTGMMVNSERELLLATSGSHSQAKISRILADKISVDPRHGERVFLELTQSGHVSMTVNLNFEIKESLDLNLVRFEFLSRVATEGALPASFSKECYEDMLAFKSRLLSAYEKRRKMEGPPDDEYLGVRLLTVSRTGMPEDRFVEVIL